MKKIAIIGAGISGLATAYLLKKKNHKVKVFEKSHRVGGYLGTHQKNGFIVEIGANGFLNNEPKTLELIESLGLSDEVIECEQDSKIRYLYFDKKLLKAPNNPKEILSSELLSFSSKLKILKELILPPKTLNDYSKLTVSDFIERHFGSEISEKIARTAFLGIYAGDTKKLLAEKTIPKIVDFAKNYRSVLKGLKNNKNKPATLHGFKKGMQTLIDKLSQNLKNEVFINHEVLSIEKTNNQFQIQYQDDSFENITSESFDEVIITTPLESLFKLYDSVIPESLIKKYSTQTVAPVRSLSVAFSKKIPFKGFGVLVSPEENKNILGFLHPTDIFKNRSPENKSLVTFMMGGDFKPEILNMSTQSSLQIALKDLESILNVKLPEVESTWIWNHIPGITQYTQETVTLVEDLKKIILSKTPNIYFNFQAESGVSINDCIRKSFEITNQI